MKIWIDQHHKTKPEESEAITLVEKTPSGVVRISFADGITEDVSGRLAAFKFIQTCQSVQEFPSITRLHQLFEDSNYEINLIERACSANAFVMFLRGTEFIYATAGDIRVYKGVRLDNMLNKGRLGKDIMIQPYVGEGSVSDRVMVISNGLASLLSPEDLRGSLEIKDNPAKYLLSKKSLKESYLKSSLVENCTVIVLGD